MAGLTALNAAPGPAPLPAQAPAAVRLFIALWPPPAVQRALLSCQQAVCSPGPARPVPAAQLHLTLHFLGTVPRQRLPALQAALCVPFAPFGLRLHGVQRWSPGGVVVVPVDPLPPALVALHGALARQLDALGLPLERRGFRPHVTLARRHAGPWPPHAKAGSELPRDGAALRWRVQRYTLVESLAGPPSAYRVLQSCAARRG